MFEPSSLMLIAATAAVAGVLAGLLGIGGGVVIVPALIVVFTTAGVDPAIRVQLAVGTSLATIMFTSVSSAWSHHRKGALHLGLAAWFAPGVIVGSVIGVLIAAWMPGRTLQGFFGVFLVAIAARMVFGTLPDDPGQRHMSRWMRVFCGTIIGGLSTMVGIGGGVLSVPIFVLLAGLTIHHAVGTAPALGLLLSVVGTVTWALRGHGVEGLPDGCVGYVAVLPAVAISVGTVSLAPVGAWLAHRLPRRQLSLAFAVLLVIVAGKLCVDAWIGERPVIEPLVVDVQGFSGRDGDARVFGSGDEVVVLVRPEAGPWKDTPKGLEVAAWFVAGALQASESPRRIWAARYPVCPTSTCVTTLDVAEGHLHGRISLDGSGLPVDGDVKLAVAAWPTALDSVPAWAEHAARSAVMPADVPRGVQMRTFALRRVPGVVVQPEVTDLRDAAARLLFAGEHDEALSTARALIALHEREQDLEGVALGHELAAAVLIASGSLDEAARHLEEVGPRARLLGDRDLDARTWMRMAEIHSALGDDAEALACMASARPWLIPGEQEGDEDLRTWATLNLDTARMQLRARDRDAGAVPASDVIGMLDAAAQGFAATHDGEGEARVLACRARLALQADDPRQAASMLEEADRTLEGACGGEAVATLGLLRAEVSLAAGDLDQAEEQLAEQAGVPSRHGWRVAWLRARLLAAGGQTAEAASLMVEAATRAPRGRIPGPHWIGLLVGPQVLFDEALVAVLAQGNADQAFEVSERGRSAAGREVSAAELAGALPADAIALVYHVLADEVIVFVVTGQAGLQVFRREIPIAELRNVVARQLDEIHGGGSGRTSPDLIPTLLPVTLQVADGTELLIIPHGPIRHAPFAVVEKGRRYLVQDHSLRFAASASDYVVAQEAGSDEVRFAWEVAPQHREALLRRYVEMDGDRAEALRLGQIALMVGEEGNEAVAPRVWGAPQLWSVAP